MMAFFVVSCLTKKQQHQQREPSTKTMPVQPAGKSAASVKLQSTAERPALIHCWDQTHFIGSENCTTRVKGQRTLRTIVLRQLGNATYKWIRPPAASLQTRGHKWLIPSGKLGALDGTHQIFGVVFFPLSLLTFRFGA